MKRKLSVVLLSLTLSLGLFLSFAPTERYFEIAKSLDIFATLFKEVNAFYVDEVEPDELIRTGIDAMLNSLDPYTNYIPEEEIESFRTLTTGQYAGIGALIGQIEEDIYITLPYEDFPARKAGIRIGDKLVSVDGVAIQGKSVSDVSSLLKGPINTPVTIVVEREGEAEQLKYTFERKKITVKNVTYAGLVNQNTGLIKLEDFTPNAGKEVGDALEVLKKEGATRVILDVRNNPGGLLSEAVNVANVFIPKNKEVVSTKGKVQEWNKTYKTLNSGGDEKIPLVVLANGGSASAAEIVSGVMQDYDRGILIGQTTFGKGLVQTTRPLTYNAQLKVTTAKYYIPSGRCIQALDYSNRNADGSVEKVSDSLKHSFFTRNGRTVYDGEGISPDIEVEAQTMTPLLYKLIQRGWLFRYANRYAAQRQEPPVTVDFKLSDTEYQNFVSWLKSEKFEYTSPLESQLGTLEQETENEKYFKDIRSSLEKLKSEAKKISDTALDYDKEIIKLILEDEIASRYFHRKGALESAFDHDEVLQKAIEVLSDPEGYESLLAKGE